MIGLIGRIIGVSGKYKGRIYGAFVFSFFKSNILVILAFFNIRSRFVINSTLS